MTCDKCIHFGLFRQRCNKSDAENFHSIGKPTPCKDFSYFSNTVDYIFANKVELQVILNDDIKVEFIPNLEANRLSIKLQNELKNDTTQGSIIWVNAEDITMPYGIKDIEWARDTIGIVKYDADIKLDFLLLIIHR